MTLASSVAKRALEGDRLRTVLSTSHLSAARGAHDIAQDVTGGSATFNPKDPEVRRLLDEGAERITGIIDETRARLQSYIEFATTEGLTVGELAKLIREDRRGAFAPWRARMIARTESATIINGASVNGYRLSGRVENVEVLDGADCDWPEGHGGGTANGTVVTLAEAQNHLIAHPGCVRAFAPILRAESRGGGSDDEE